MKLLLLFIAHFLGDFILQTTVMAENKKGNSHYFLLHCLVYSLLIFSVLIWFRPVLPSLYAGLIISLSHAGIDYARNVSLNRLSAKQEINRPVEFVIFVFDQILHLFIIVLTVLFILEYSTPPNFFSEGIDGISRTALYNGTVIAFLYILCLSPAAIFIKKVFILFAFQDDNGHQDLIKSGYLIGVLERIIIVTLWLNGELEAIGLIIAAKSLARFKQLNDRNFAEKYLVGTLLSVAIALLCITLGNFLLIS